MIRNIIAAMSAPGWKGNAIEEFQETFTAEHVALMEDVIATSLRGKSAIKQLNALQAYRREHGLTDDPQT